MRACPSCAEKIQNAAIKCKHCGAEVLPVPKAPTPGWLVAVCLIGGLMALGAFAVFYNDIFGAVDGWLVERQVRSMYETKGVVVTRVDLHREADGEYVGVAIVQAPTLLGMLPQGQVCRTSHDATGKRWVKCGTAEEMVVR
ncbi:MAG TPA: hypothetical protein VGQ83_26760 [Polyangia bacterium]|jgi:hypothetical protein